MKTHSTSHGELETGSLSAQAVTARQQQHLAAIHEVVTATSSTLDLDEVLDALIEKLRTLSNSDRVAVMLLDPRTDQLTAAAARDASGRLPVGLRLGRGEGAAGRVMEAARPFIVPDLRRFPHFAPPHKVSAAPAPNVPRALSYAGFPLVSRGRIVGVASLIGTTPREFPPDDLTFIETICRAAAVSIDNALAHQELRRRHERERESSREKLRESERLRESLVQMIVHDLRSPLASICGHLEILAQEAAPRLGPESKQDISFALAAAQRMAGMIGDILDVSKMEAQQMKLAVGECNLVEVIRQSLDDLASLVGTRQIVFEPASLSVVAFADAEIVMRIVQNLLANALRLTPADGVVKVGIVREDDHVRIFVSDNGPGIPADLHRKIFDKYAQASAAPASRQRTFGLGLAFCQLAVEAHGGRIGVDSEEGKGSTFWFTLPSARHTWEGPARLD